MIKKIGISICMIAITIGLIALGITVQLQIDKNFVSYCNEYYGLNNYTLQAYNCGITICYKCCILEEFP